MVPLNISLLGSFQASIEEMPVTGFRSDKVRALLIYLVVESGRPHRRETLSGLFWPDYAQKAAQSNLRKSLYHLRNTIDKAKNGLSDKLLNITRQTIQINPEFFRADVHQFQDNLAFIKKHRHQHLHSCPECLARLKETADLYQANFADGFSLADASTFESWLLIQRESVHQETLGVMEHLAAAYEISGDYEQARLYATRQIVLEPWRENAYRQLMRALALDGRRTEALAQFENCRKTLLEELAVEPAAETLALFEQIKEGSLVPKETITSIQLRHFPTEFTPFIGREAQLAAIESKLGSDECRLLTLTGSGGIGKTRLSIEAARRMAGKKHFTDGIYFVPLAAVKEGDYLLMTVAAQLDISIYGRSQLRQVLQNYLADKDVLLVLDNFEQLVSESSLLSDLLQETRKLKCLVSSRESLNIRAEERLLIEGMENESAASLFLQAANRIWPGYKPVGRDLEAIEEICRLVAGIPLAVEMAAGWVKSLDPPMIVDQIKHNFEILETTIEEVPERHRSMRIVFEESWKMLRPSEQTALAQFSIFEGGFSLYAALEITDATINEVAALLDKSLLEYPGKSRYKLHELLRQFAQLKLNETSKTAVRSALEQQYIEYYLDLVNRNEVYFFGKAPHVGMKDIEAEYKNVRHAWRLALKNNQLELASKALPGLKMYFRLTGQYEDGMNQFSAAITALGAKDGSYIRDRLLCRVSISAAYFAIQVGELDRATALLATATEMSKKEDWPDLLAEADQTKGNLFYNKGEFIRANAVLQRGILYFEEVGNKIHLAESYFNLGLCFSRSDRWQDMVHILTKALNISEELSYVWAIVSCQWALGYLYREHGRRDLALKYYDQSNELAKEINFLPGIFRGYMSIGLVYEDLGQYDKALEYYEMAYSYAQETADESGLIKTKGCIARVFWKVNRLEEGLALINESLPIARDLGFKVHIAWQLIVKAELLFKLGRYKKARTVNEEGLRLARETTLFHRIIQAEILAVRLHVALGEKETALHKLTEMLKTAEDVYTLAAVHDELWKLTQDKDHAEQALANYRLAYAKDDYIEYKERIEVLEEASI